MPHGMFRRELLAEAPTAEAEATTPVVLRPGAVVVVAGLVKLPVFNGCRGLVKSYDAEAERYTVKLFTAKGEQVAKLRRENLQHPSQHPTWQLCGSSTATLGQPSPMLTPLAPPSVASILDGSAQPSSAVLEQSPQMLVPPPPPPSLASHFDDSFQLASAGLGQFAQMLAPLPPPPPPPIGASLQPTSPGLGQSAQMLVPPPPPSFPPQLDESMLAALAIIELGGKIPVLASWDAAITETSALC
jgi:hypothetical protein